MAKICCAEEPTSMFGRGRVKASSSTFVENVVNGFASFKRQRTAYLIQVGPDMTFVEALREKGRLPSRAILEVVLSVCGRSVYRETLSRLFQVVLLSSYVGHCKNKGVVLREEESRREDRRTERGKGKGKEALTVAQTTWIYDAGVELKRPVGALATQVHDVGVGVGTRGTNTRTREGVRGQKAKSQEVKDSVLK